MDADTLAKMFELFAKLGDQGTTAFIYWLVIKNGASVIMGLICGGTIITVALLITKAISRHCANEACIREIGELVGIKIYGEPYMHERMKVLKAVEKLATKQ